MKKVKKKNFVFLVATVLLVAFYVLLRTTWIFRSKWTGGSNLSGQGL